LIFQFLVDVHSINLEQYLVVLFRPAEVLEFPFQPMKYLGGLLIISRNIGLIGGGPVDLHFRDLLRNFGGV